MFKAVDVKDELALIREKTRSGGDKLLSEANRILKQDLFSEEKILDHLGKYNRAFECLDEEDLDHDLIFTQAELKEICIRYRLKFLDSRCFKPRLPYEAAHRMEVLDVQYAKKLTECKILAPLEAFNKKEPAKAGLLFVKTNYDNYYLVHQWGKKLQWHRLIKYWPLRSFETLFFSIITTTLLITLSLPTWLITLDAQATYWSGYRAAAFFHLLIFNMGVTAYITFAFTKNFSSSVWNQEQDFD